MIQMQRSLQLLSTSSSSSFFPARSSSALLLRPSSFSSSSSFMAQLQFRAIQNLQGLYFPCSSSLGATRNYTHCSHLKLRRAVRVSSSFVSFNHSNLVPHSLSTSFNNNNDNNNNDNDNGGVLGSYGCGFFAKRHFSQVPKAADNKKESVGGFSKYWKKRKPLAAHSNSKGFDSRISASSKDVDAVTKSEQNVRDEELGASVSTFPAGNNSIKSRASGKKNKQLRSKKNKDQSSSASALEQHADGKSSEGNSQEKTSVASKSGKSPSCSSEKKLAGKSSKEVTAGSASIEQQSNKKNSNVNSIEAAKRETQKPQKMGKLNPLGQGKLKPMYPPIAKSVVVVESVTKAQVIQGYLGDMFEVLPSYGHVRDLAARSGSVRPNDDFSMVWEVPSAAWTHLKSIKVALNGAENLILASDPDREGEAIAWHIIEMLEQQHALRDDITVARVVFNEITETSIKSALQAPREIDVNLVHAYLARRALDYLIGFNISPLLWRKLPGCQSAGRVQSAALSLICDRETEINEFKPQEYWTVAAELSVKEMGSCVNARLTHFGSKKLDQYSISTDAEAKDIENKINAAEFQVIASKKNKMRKNPPTPYITSTLQQDAANRLNFSATNTMKLAQKLYEGVQLSDGKAKGLITYLRTDGLHISDEAVQDIRALVSERYGPNFASGGARKYYKKVKNAQEAHEAIRPTEIRMLPSMLSEVLDEDSLKLYTLIWSRTVACQMEPVTIEQVQVDIGNADKSIILRSSSSRVEFPGYQAVYEDVEAGSVRHKENEAHDRQESFGTIKSLKPGDPLSLGEVELKQHFTQPPPRYSEGSLVKKLEELGIGRPSTYASTLKVLQDRDYVTVKTRVLYPEFRGRMVSAFLSHHFTEVTDYSFTADMENELDNVSAGLTDWKGLLRDYWTRFSSYCKRTESVHIHQVEKMLEKKFGDFLFGSLLDNKRTCPSCMEGTLIFKVSRYGAGYFIGCDQHPKCKYIAKTLYGDDEDEETPQNNVVEEPKLLGLHPASNEKIFLKKGPYGYYVQLGEDRKNYVPKRASVSNIKDVHAITVDDAIELLRYPVTLGNHPKDGHPVILKLAKVGFSIRHRRTIATVPKNLKPEDITMEKALELLSGKDVRRSGRPKRQPRVEEAMEAI